MTLQLSFREKAFKRITPADISHQVFRLRQISDLKFAVFGHTGSLLDPAREEFIHTAGDSSVDYTIIDAVDFARLAVIQGLLCPRDARRVRDG